MTTERTCANCHAPTKSGIHCKDCDTVIFIAERIGSYMENPSDRRDFIDMLEAGGLNTPRAIWLEGEKRGAKKMKILASQIGGLTDSRKLPEIHALMKRGYCLARSNAKREEAAILSKKTSFSAGDSEVNSLTWKIRNETGAKIGHSQDGKDGKAYAGFTPAETDENEFDF